MPHAAPEEGVPDTSDLKNAKTVLPVGMSMNPSAAAGLEGCTPEQIGLEPASPNVSCPSGSRIGTVNLEVPTLPRESLPGPIFLGKPAGKQIEGPPYTIYLDAESGRYGVKVRLKGTVTPDPNDGPADDDVQRKPAGAVQQGDPEVQRRRLRRARQPARMHGLQSGNGIHPVVRRRRRVPVGPLLDRRLHGLAASVRADPGHLERTRPGRLREHVHVRVRTA